MKLLSCCLLALSSATAILAQPKEPKIGDVAPPLSTSAWVQGDAVNGYQKGTVYVLEFWATWCGSCHVAQPHINDLAKKMSGKVVFVNISAEEKGVVGPFLSKSPMATRVALDNKGATTIAYGVKSIPHTVIVDGSGKIAAITRPEAVTEEALAKVIAGTKIDLPIKANKAADLEWDAELAGVRTSDSQSMGHAIIQRSDAVTSVWKSGARNGRLVGDGVVLENMIHTAYGSQPENLENNLKNVDRGPFRYSIKSPDGSDETAKTMLKELLLHNFSFKAEWKEVEKELPVLRFDAAKGNGKFKKSTETESMGAARHGFIRYTKTKMNTIARDLGAYGFGQTVVDETGLTGEYDIELRWNVADPEGFKNALKELGFSFTVEKRKIKILVVDPR